MGFLSSLFGGGGSSSSSSVTTTTSTEYTTNNTSTTHNRSYNLSSEEAKYVQAGDGSLTVDVSDDVVMASLKFADDTNEQLQEMQEEFLAKISETEMLANSQFNRAADLIENERSAGESRFVPLFLWSGLGVGVVVMFWIWVRRK